MLSDVQWLRTGSHKLSSLQKKNLKSEIPDSTSYLVKSDSALHGIPELRAEQQPVVLKRKHELAQLCLKAPSNLILVNEIFFVRLEGRINQKPNGKQKNIVLILSVLEINFTKKTCVWVFWAFKFKNQTFRAIYAHEIFLLIFTTFNGILSAKYPTRGETE